MALFGWVVLIIFLAFEILQIFFNKFSEGMDAMTIMFYKYTISLPYAIPILIGYLIYYRQEHIEANFNFTTLFKILIVWCPGGSILNSIIMVASRETSISHFCCIMGLAPIFMILIEAKSIRKLERKSVIAIILLLVSNVIVLLGDATNGKLLGDIYSFISLLILVYYVKANDLLLQGVPSIFVATMSMIINSCVSLRIVNYTKGIDSLQQIRNPKFMWNAIFKSVYGYESTILLIVVCRYFPLEVISLLMQLTPVIAQVISSALGYERISAQSIIGAILITLGISLTYKKKEVKKVPIKDSKAN